ncbi:MAG TPA: c-type cytochrome [Candidatus Limnocylindrales bacterium]|nr:c-type cytochrome [Candidatus Limnocylindrales bacterium]
MHVVFPPLIDLPLLFGLLALALGTAGFLLGGRLGTNSVGRAIVTLRLPALAVGVVLAASAFFAATPQTQLPNPMPRTVDSVAIGSELYLNNCAACHGIDARGGGPMSDTTPVRPPPLAGRGSHLDDHSDGDLHYFISYGMPGGMPAWQGTLRDEQIWHVVNFLRDLQQNGIR